MRSHPVNFAWGMSTELRCKRRNSNYLGLEIALFSFTNQWYDSNSSIPAVNHSMEISTIFFLMAMEISAIFF